LTNSSVLFDDGTVQASVYDAQGMVVDASTHFDLMI
jgi:hypothetical protein